MFDNIVEIQSSDTNVKKFVFEKEDAVAEAVLYKYPTYKDRTVICCSTQSVCPMGCRFCGAGDYFVRNLTTEEIIAQPVHLLNTTGVKPESIDKLQIMFMSMGEPMLAWKQLRPAIKELHLQFPNAALLISTSGPDVVDNFDDLIELAMHISTIGLQFSVHESTDEARDKLIPFKNKLSLNEISEIGRSFALLTGHQAFFNYCVHEKNNTIEDADRLRELFHPDYFQATISVICERDEHVAAANKRQEQLALDFTQLLLERGFSTRVFNPAGQDDIGGGCGQLWYVQDWMKNNQDLTKKTVGYGKEVVHTPC